MANLTADRLTSTRSGHETRTYSVPMAANGKVFQGGMVFATAGLAHGGTPLAGDAYVGIALASVDNTGGSASAMSVPVRRGVVKLDNAGTNAIAQANLGQIAYATTDHELATAGPVAVGKIDEIDADGGIWVFDSGGSTQVGGYDDVVLGTTAPSNITAVTYVETTGTVTGPLADGDFVGQTKRIAQSVATGTPAGTITGHFETLAGVAEGTLNLGTAVAAIVDLIWTGTKWRQASSLGGTGSSFST